MSTLTINNYKSEVERTLLTVLRLAFLRRSTVANLSALAALDVSATADGELAYVTDQARVYAYSRFSGAVVASPTIIAPTTIPSAYSGARWIRQESGVSYGPNWRAPVHARTSGKLQAIELFAGDGDTTQKWERVQAAAPALLVECTNDVLTPLSAGYPGALYRAELPFVLTVFSDNNRASPSSSWGSPASVSETDDPGPAAIIGDVRKVLAGLRGDDLGLDGLDRVEIGDSRLIDEEFAERFLVWELDVSVRCVVAIEDEDLDAMRIDVQPELADSQVAGRFDPLNYVATGYVVAPGAGLTAAPSAGIALIAGAAVASTPPDHTFTADRDTYRDLAADGTFTYVEAYRGHPAPAVTAGALRVGVTTTDASDIVADRILCSYAQTFRDSYQIAP